MSHCSQKRWQMLQPQSSGGCWTHVWEYEELPVFRQPDTFVQPTWGHLLKVLQEMHSKAVLQYTSYKLHFTVFIINKFFLVSASLLFFFLQPPTLLLLWSELSFLALHFSSFCFDLWFWLQSSSLSQQKAEHCFSWRLCYRMFSTPSALLLASPPKQFQCSLKHRHL